MEDASSNVDPSAVLDQSTNKTRVVSAGTSSSSSMKTDVIHAPLLLPAQTFNRLSVAEELLRAAVAIVVSELKPTICGENYTQVMQSGIIGMLGDPAQSEIILSGHGFDILQNTYPLMVQCLLTCVKEKGLELKIQPPSRWQWKHVMKKCIKNFEKESGVVSNKESIVEWWDDGTNAVEPQLDAEEVDFNSPEHKKYKQDEVTQDENPQQVESDDEVEMNDEGGHIHLDPVIPLPNTVQVVTGEEREEVLYNHRAKLFHWAGGEWKERGLGDIKILKHKENGHLRLLMRREQVLTVCLDHRLSPEIDFLPKGENNRSFQWWAFAHSDKEMRTEHFAVLFKTEEIAKGFLNAALLAQSSLDEDVKLIAILEPQVSAEEIAKALELQLPFNFFTYKLRPDCRGCVGCADEEEDAVGNTTTFATLGAQKYVNTEIGATSRSGAATPVSSSGSNLAEYKNPDDEMSGEEEGNERHDPYFDPAMALPDLITLRTGEEDEELVFGERAILYRFDAEKREWKERGDGDLKLLLHHGLGRYRLLLRREQVHKTVLNHLLTQDLDLQPLINSSKNGLCWGALNFAEDKARFEKLAVTFQDEDTLSEFNLKVAEAKEQLIAQAKALEKHSKVTL